MSALAELGHAIANILSTPDWIALAAIGVIAIGLGLFTESLTALVTSTFIALVAFGVVMIVRGAISTKRDIGAIGDLVQADWHAFMGWQVQMLVAYAILFAVIIAAVSGIRRLMRR